jgi:predicted transcriptional regulator
MCYSALRIKHMGSPIMPDSTFTFRVDEDLKAAFTAAAKANDRTGAQVLREVMRDYAAEEAPPTAEYVEWLRKKVEKSIEQADAGLLIPGDEVEVYFAKKRADLRSRIVAEAAE